MRLTIRPADFPMLRLDPECDLHFVDKGPPADRDRLQPAIVSGDRIARACIRDPLAMCPLKVRHFCKAT